MKKTCIICKVSFESSTVSLTCGDACKHLRKNNLGRINTKNYRDNHKHDENFKKLKKTYDTHIFYCSGCDTSYSACTPNPKKTALCKKCYTKSQLKCEIMASRSKPKHNTTGYIGVYIIKKAWGEHDIWGVLASLEHNKLNIFRNKYKDIELHDKTFIQAAVDRDIFILQNDLPHTRNFTDTELEARMIFLGYSELVEMQDTHKFLNGKLGIAEQRVLTSSTVSGTIRQHEQGA